jgi:hypothetical protein
MTGVLTVIVTAPDDDQKLFPLIPVEDRPKLMSKAWVQATMTELQVALNQIIEQTLLRLHLYPQAQVVQPGGAVDQNGKLVYTFQVPVQSFPPGAVPAQPDGNTPQ